MDDSLEKEIKRREIINSELFERFLDPTHALDAIIGQLQEQKSPALAPYFIQNKINAVAPVTKDVSVFIATQYASCTNFYLQVLVYKAKKEEEARVVAEAEKARLEFVKRFGFEEIEPHGYKMATYEYTQS